MSQAHRIPGLLQTLRKAFAAKNSHRASEAIDALLPLTLTATDQQGVAASLETLAYACQLCLVLKDPDRGERFLAAFKARVAEIGDTALSDGHRPMFAMFEADLAALRESGVARGDFVDAFFVDASQLLGVAVGESREPKAAENLLQQIAELPAIQTQDDLTRLISLVDRIAEHRFRAGNRGEVVAWLDAVEPSIPLCEPEAAMRFAVAWSSMYRNTALHGNAERLSYDVMARFEEMIGNIPPPPGADPNAWAAHKASTIGDNERFAALDRAMILGTREEVAAAAKAVLAAASAVDLPPDRRRFFEDLAAGNFRQAADAMPLDHSDLGYNKSLLAQALAQIQARQPSDASESLAALLTGGAERDGDLGWGVPLHLTHCLFAVASERPGFLPVATSLLKEAVRQLERQKLEAAANAPGALYSAEGGAAADAYEQLRDLLLHQGRIGEAVRVETLHLEQACRVPNAPDQSLRDMAAERLPAFQAERDHWAAWRRSAAQVRPGEGGRWLKQMASQPPKFELARERGFGGQPLEEGELSLGFLVVGEEILTVARGWRGSEYRLRHRIPSISLHDAILRLQMAIRQEDEEVAAPAEALGAMLFGPIIDVLRQEAPRRLLIEPTGVIINVPFSALRVDGAWLAERYEILLPGGWRVPRNDDIACDSLVSICVPQSGREAALRWVEKDKDEISAFAGATGQRLRTVSGPGARLDAVLAVLSSPPRTLHFSGHFRADIVDMAKSAFLLADGERLTVEALSQCPLRGCDLALLLGCETASRPPAAPDSAIVGVDAALLRLGVRSVVSSQWPVDDHASHLFLVALLAALREPGMSKAAAVQLAQMAVLHCGYPPFRHPVHWAAFTLAGQG
jgi:CHAT domain-containing protein